MTAFTWLSPVLAKSTDDRLFFFCPGCQHPHGISHGAGPGPRWSWNGSVDRPTFTPSVLVRTGSAIDPSIQWEEGDPPRICHTFVTDGQIQFLSDCDHSLAGQTVDLPAWGEQ